MSKQRKDRTDNPRGPAGFSHPRRVAGPDFWAKDFPGEALKGSPQASLEDKFQMLGVLRNSPAKEKMI
jgi:hypothetical protein